MQQTNATGCLLLLVQRASTVETKCAHCSQTPCIRLGKIGGRHMLVVKRLFLSVSILRKEGGRETLLLLSVRVGERI